MAATSSRWTSSACTPSRCACSPICRDGTSARWPATSATRPSWRAAPPATWRRRRSSGRRCCRCSSALSVRTWSALKAWLDEPAPRARRARRVYPLALDRRRALPDGPGVYRFVRRSGDVLYVGKAASLRKRVAGHFTGRGAAASAAWSCSRRFTTWTSRRPRASSRLRCSRPTRSSAWIRRTTCSCAPPAGRPGTRRPICATRRPPATPCIASARCHRSTRCFPSRR